MFHVRNSGRNELFHDYRNLTDFISLYVFLEVEEEHQCVRQRSIEQTKI